MSLEPQTIGLLYAGEMGTSLAALLYERGHRIITTGAERSGRTLARAQQAGITVVDGILDVVRAADIILSVVPPAAAAQVAVHYASLAHHSPNHAIFVDCNSIGPELASLLATHVERAGRAFVDAAIHGQAGNLKTSAALYLAGSRANEIAVLFDGLLRTCVLGSTPGRASAMKMLLGGLSKGLCTLFLELAALAQRQQMLGELLDESRRFYPGMMDAVERMLPTYPRHAARRTGEMDELQQTAAAHGQSPCMIDASRHLLEAIAAVGFGPITDPAAWDIATLTKHLCARGFLASPAAPLESAPSVV